MATTSAEFGFNAAASRKIIRSAATLAVAALAVPAGAASVTYTTAGAQPALTLASGDTVNLRNDGSVTFTPASITLPSSGSTTLNFDVNNNGSAATGQTLTLAGTLTFASGTTTTTANTINVTGGNGYGLALGNISVPSSGGNSANHSLTLNALAGLNTGTITLGSWGETLNLAGTSTISVGNIQLNSNGSHIVNFGSGSDSPTVILGAALTTSGSRASGMLAAEIKNGATVQLNNINALTNFGGQSNTALTIDSGGKLLLNDSPTASYTSQTLVAGVTLNGGTITNYQNLNTIGTLTVGSAGGALQGSFTDSNGTNRRSLNIGTLNGTGNLTVGDSGLGSGAGAGSLVRITNASGGNYNGTISVSGTNSAGGSYLVIDGSNALANATVNVASDNTSGTAAFAGFDGTSSLGFNIAAVKIGGLSGSGSVRLNFVTSATGIGLTTGNNGTDTTYSGSMTGAGSLTKIGNGNMTLAGSNSYTGATTVNGGTLTVGVGGVGSLGSTAVTVNSGGTLAGSGSVAGSINVQNGGTLSAGNSIGSQTVGGLTLNDGGNLNWQMFNATAAAGTGYDVYNVSGAGVLNLSALTGANKFNINLWSLGQANSDAGGNAINFNSGFNQSWTLIATNATITNFNAAAFAVNTAAMDGTSGFANALNNGTFSVGLSTDGTDLVLNYTAAPEPATLGAVAMGVMTLLHRRRRK